MSYLLNCRLSIENQQQSILRKMHLANCPRFLNRKTQRPKPLPCGKQKRTSYPRNHPCFEYPVILLRIVLVNRFDQANVALLDEIQQIHTWARTLKSSRNRDNQRPISINQ